MGKLAPVDALADASRSTRDDAGRRPAPLDKIIGR